MSLFDTAAVAALLSGGTNATPAKGERKQSQLWLNVGITLMGADGNPVFVTLPAGIPFDSLEPIEIKSTAKPEWRHLAEAKNAVLAAVREKVKDLKPGESIDLGGLTVQAYHRAAIDNTPSTDNPLTAQLGAMLAGTAAPAPAPAGVSG